MPIRVCMPLEMDAGKLISVVQEYEELYNLQHPEYSNRERREKIWKEIGRRMNQPSNACKAQWTRIRDNHRKALNLRKNKSGQAVKKMKPPKFHMELHFLTPFLTEDEDKLANITASEQQGGNPQEGHESDSDDDSDAVLSSSPSSQAIPPTATPSCHRRKRTFSTPQPIPAPVLEKYHQSNEMTTGGSSNPDRLTSFFINMAETVKTFPLEDQIRIKSELFQIVNDVEMRIAQQMRGFPSSSMYGSSVSPAPDTQKHSSHSGQPSTSRYSGQPKQNTSEEHKKKSSRTGHDDVGRQREQSTTLGQEYTDVRPGHGQKEAQAEDYVAEEDNKEGLLSLCDVGFREYWHCPE